MAQTPEADAFLKRLAAIPPTPGESLLTAISPSLSDEETLRRLFATQRDHPRLKDPLVGLVNVYGPNTDCTRNIRARVVDPDDKDDLNRSYVMPLSDKDRRKHGELAMAQTMDDFRTRWNIFSEGSLSSLVDWNNIIAAGGSVLACLSPLPDRVVSQGSKRAIRKYYHAESYPASDVDLFIYGLSPKEAEAKAIAIYEAVRDSVPWEVTAVRTKNAISIHCQYPYRPVQIVLRLYQSPAEILAGFDVDSSCVAYDGQNVYATPRALVALMTQSNRVSMDRRSPSYEVRLAKYASRGFEVYVPQLRREDFDPTIFERSLAKVEGLARLLVLEKLSDPSHRDGFLATRRTVRGRPTQPWSRRAYRRAKRLTGDLKSQAEFGGLQMNDYDVAFHIPYGPGYDARKIEKMVYQTDLGMNSTFNPKNKDRRLHRHPAFFGTMAECLEDCCEYCPEPLDEEETALQVKEDEQYIRGRITFLQDDPGRQSITGSFKPIDSGEWSEQAYIRPIAKLFTAIAQHDRQAALDFVKRYAESTSVKARDHLGRTPLQFAIMCGAEDIAIDLIEIGGARMTSRLVDGRTSLHLACQMDLAKAVQKMLEVSEKNKKEAEEKERLEKERLEKEKTGEKSDDVDMDEEKEDRIRDSSEDDWSSEDDIVSASDSEGEIKEQTKPFNDQDALEENDEEPDVLDIDAPDWDQSLTPIGYAIIGGSIEIVKILIAAGADVKSPRKAVDSSNGTQSFHPLRLTALIDDTQTACTMAETLVGGGAISSAADDSMTTIFHRLVAANKVELIETLLKVDPTTKVATRFLATPSYYGAFSPIITAIQTPGNVGRAMTALLMAFGGCKPWISQEDFDKSISANPTKRLSTGYDPYMSNVVQPLEASIIAHNDIYQLIVDLDPDSVKKALFKTAWNYRNTVNYRMSLLDWANAFLENVQKKLESAKKRLVEQTKKDATTAKAVTEATPTEGLSGTDLSWEETFEKLEAAVQKQKAKQPTYQSWNSPKTAKEIQEEVKQWQDACDYTQQVTTALKDAGAQTWNAMYPDMPAIPNINQYNDNNNNNVYTNEPSTQKLYFRLDGEYQTYELGAYTNDKYDELYEAVWKGDHKKMRELCLPPEDGSKLKTGLLQMAVFRRRWTSMYEAATGYTPLFVAIQAGRWDTAREVLDIVKEQFTKDEEEVKKKEPDFKRHGINLHDSDEDEDSDAESMDSAATPKLGFGDIHERFDEVRSNVTASRLFACAPTMRVNGEPLTVTPLQKAIYDRDADAFTRICTLMKECCDPPTGPSDHERGLILQCDCPALLDEYIRQTGQGITVKKNEITAQFEAEEAQAKAEGEASDATETTSDDSGEYKLYLGLNVHGKKRKDLARKGDPNAPYQGREVDVLLLWQASQHNSLEIIEYLATAKPLEAFQSYMANNPSTARTKVLKTIKDLENQLPELLGFSPNAVNESALLAAIARAKHEHTFQIAKKLIATSPKQVAATVNLPVKQWGLTPLLAHCGRHGSPATFDWLLANGADVYARDNKGWNIYHYLCAHPEDNLTLTKHVLSKLSADKTTTLLQEQSRGPRNTPFTIAVKSGNIDLVNLLLETQLPAVLPTLHLRDVQGSTPLHCAIYKAFPKIVESLLKHSPPECLYVENGVGATPLEIVALAHLTDRLRNDFPGSQDISGLCCDVYFNQAPPFTPPFVFIGDNISAVEKDLVALRRIIEKANLTGVLVNKPTLLSALMTFADRTEGRLLKWKEEQATKEQQDAEVKVEAEKPDDGENSGQSKVKVNSDSRNVQATYETFTKAVVRVHKRTLIHVHDVQQVVLSTVGEYTPHKQHDDSDSEGDDNEDGLYAQNLVLHSHLGWLRSDDWF